MPSASRLLSSDLRLLISAFRFPNFCFQHFSISDFCFLAPASFPAHTRRMAKKSAAKGGADLPVSRDAPRRVPSEIFT
jgi:hypothetical protein